MSHGHYKHGFGHVPIVASTNYGRGNDTEEVLVAGRRAVNEGANSTADHIRGLDKALWERVVEQDGYERHNAWVIDATKVIGLKDYPAGTRLYLRTEPLHPGAQASLFDIDGHRVPAFHDSRRRARGRCENSIKALKSSGIGKLPIFGISANQLWTDLAMNLVAWMQLAILPADHDAGT